MVQTPPPSSDGFFPHTDKFLLDVLDSLGHPFYVVDADTYEILVANRAVGPAPPPGMTCHEWFQRSAKPCGILGNDCPVDKARNARVPVVVDHTHFDERGQLRYTEVHAHPMFDAAGKVFRVIEYALDITERRQAEQRLKVLNNDLEKRVAQRTRDAEIQAAQLRRLAIELTQVENRERHRLAAILHDDVQQLLLGARLRIASIQRNIDDSAVQSLLSAVDDTIGSAIATCRSLSVELGLPILSISGLAAALVWLGAQMQERFGLKVVVTADDTVNPRDEDVAILLFQSVRELLLNVVKHAEVSNATVTMTGLIGQRVQIIVEDSGVGFDPDKETQAVAAPGTLGLFSVGERLKLLGGALTIESSPGQGTRAILTAPQRGHDR